MVQKPGLSCLYVIVKNYMEKSKFSKSSQQYVWTICLIPNFFTCSSAHGVCFDKTFNLIQNFNQFSIKSTKELKIQIIKSE